MAGRRFRRLLLALALGVSVGILPCGADWRLSSPNDPRRIWSASVLTTVGYDDNTSTSISNEEASVTLRIQPEVTVRFPGTRTSGQLRYSYAAAFYDERGWTPPDESHLFDGNVSHAFSPRLTVSLSDALRRGVDPALTGAIERQRGGFINNNLSGSANYLLTGRTSINLNQTWERIMYDRDVEAATSDRDSFTTVGGVSHALDERTFLGGSYRYSATDYLVGSSTNDERNADSHAVYATWIHRFQPKLIAQVNAGVQFAFLGNASDVGPYVGLSSSYNFGRDSTVAAAFNYNIQVTEVAAYRSSEQAALSLSLQHQFTRKLRAVLEGAYVLATYGNLNPTFRDPLNITQREEVTETSWRTSLTGFYSFATWAQLYLSLSHEEVDSDLDNPFTNLSRSFKRNRVFTGLRLQY